MTTRAHLVVELSHELGYGISSRVLGVASSNTGSCDCSTRRLGGSLGLCAASDDAYAVCLAAIAGL
jgi:hypothetical protein